MLNDSYLTCGNNIANLNLAYPNQIEKASYPINHFAQEVQ